MNWWLTTVVAIAIASDAFSVSLGIGTQSLTISRIGKLSLLVGAFHVIMPLFGLYLGDFLAAYLEEIGEIIGGALLLVIGYKLIREYFQEDQDGGLLNSIDFTEGTGMFIFAISVSIDALTVGFTLGLAGAASIITAIVFGVVALIMTGAGLYMGQQLQGWLQGKGELLGGVLISLIGFYFIIF